MACEQSIRRMGRVFLKDPDNVIDKKLTLMTKERQFFTSSELFEIEHKIVKFYADHFTDGDENAARDIIKFTRGVEARKDDILKISLAAGALLILVPQCLFIHYSKTSQEIANAMNPEFFTEHNGVANLSPGNTLVC